MRSEQGQRLGFQFEMTVVFASKSMGKNGGFDKLTIKSVLI